MKVDDICENVEGVQPNYNSRFKFHSHHVAINLAKMLAMDIVGFYRELPKKDQRGFQQFLANQGHDYLEDQVAESLAEVSSMTRFELEKLLKDVV